MYYVLQAHRKSMALYGGIDTVVPFRNIQAVVDGYKAGNGILPGIESDPGKAMLVPEIVKVIQDRTNICLQQTDKIRVQGVL